MTDKQEQDRYDIIHNFMMNNYTEVSTEQHYKDAREFLVYITKFYDIFSKLRTEILYDMRDFPYNNQPQKAQKIMKDTLFNNNEFNTDFANVKEFCDKFLQEDRDEYSVVRKIIEIYNFKKINIGYLQIQNIKNLLEFYLTGDVETMCKSGDKDEIDEFNYLKQLSLMANKSGKRNTKYV